MCPKLKETILLFYYLMSFHIKLFLIIYCVFYSAWVPQVLEEAVSVRSVMCGRTGRILVGLSDTVQQGGKGHNC
jgi:hypothetical protein